MTNTKEIGLRPMAFEIGTCVFYGVRFTEHQLTTLKQEIQEIQNNFDGAISYNESLFGHIKREYLLDKCKKSISDLLTPHLINFNDKFKITESFNVIDKNLPIRLDKMWVNFQQKHEFNPPHNHSGIFSFVIWTKIPFNLEDELNLYQVTGKSTTSCFNFLYTGIQNSIQTHTIEVDKSSENVCIIFPSSATHFVNPFYTSDDYRISVSGNFKFFIE